MPPPLTRTASAALDNTLAALADPTRRGVIDLLRERPHRAGELAAAARMSAPAMSRHLRVLRAGKLIEESHPENDARQRIYRLLPQPFDDLQNWLEQIQQFWTGQLDSLKAYAESASDAP
jgi:DNA-binding transcriptional ArsR family regulator